MTGSRRLLTVLAMVAPLLVPVTASAAASPRTAAPADTARVAHGPVATGSRSHAVLRVRGVLPGADGVFPRRAAGDAPALWLDITLRAGRAAATTSVPLVPVPGTRSVLVRGPGASSGVPSRLADLPEVW
ncbi:hypothetical protein [Phycicoccus sonneratiae]|uniref:Uncharacterized protein n=1 Tax=Phycicoccus sonneratiae TaxID=2807628 RepID=A0ABS2CKH3_9MICO|nr:hypothetical protein [Phycicoccus sonneraticus]MBM6400385.1 hypothetical protein [Phycicoccus sonneraticus]